MRHIDSTVTGSLEGSEETGSDSGAVETDIKDGLEWSALIVRVLNVEELSVDFGLSLKIDLELGVDATGEEESGGVGSGVSLKSNLDSVVLELMGVGGGKATIFVELGGEHLDNDVTVGESDDHTVLAGTILVLVLDDHLLTGIVVGLALTTTLILDLEPLEVGAVLNYLDETHLDNSNCSIQPDLAWKTASRTKFRPRFSNYMRRV